MANKESLFSKIVKKASTDRLVKMRIFITKIISKRTQRVT